MLYKALHDWASPSLWSISWHFSGYGRRTKCFLAYLPRKTLNGSNMAKGSFPGIPTTFYLHVAIFSKSRGRLWTGTPLYGKERLNFSLKKVKKNWFNGQIYTLKKTLNLLKNTVFQITYNKSPLRSSNRNLFINITNKSISTHTWWKW